MRGCRALLEDEEKLMSAALAAGRDRALWKTGVRSGFRISELLSLKVGQVRQNGRVVEEVYVERRSMKGKKEGRRVPLHEEARQTLAEWVTPAMLDDQFLFLSREGRNRPISRAQAWRLIKAAAKKCGLTGKIATHSMRKLFAKRVYENTGQDLLATKEALGHRSVDSTTAYLSFDKSKVRDAILK